MIDFFHSSGNSSLFQIELIGLLIAERTVLSPARISYAGIWSVPGDRIPLQDPPQPLTHWAEDLVARHITEEQNSQPHSCVNFRTRIG
jgi:hypothetical protein